MTDLDKKHNDEALNVLKWEYSQKNGITKFRAKHGHYYFSVIYADCELDCDLLITDGCKPIKIKGRLHIDIAKAQAELFILNLKR